MEAQVHAMRTHQRYWGPVRAAVTEEGRAGVGCAAADKRSGQPGLFSGSESLAECGPAPERIGLAPVVDSVAGRAGDLLPRLDAQKGDWKAEVAPDSGFH